MRSLLLAGLCLFLIKSPGKLLAQNKTLGVGVTTPNANAALHIESPTSNQGFIMPRLTTVQRTGMNPILTAADKGLMLFDTDLNTIFIWNGSAWQTTGEVAGGIKLTYPYMDSVVVNTGTTDLFALKYNSDEPKRIMRIENQSAANGSSALSVYTAGQGPGGYFQGANPASTSSTLYATTNSDAGGDLAPVAVYGESTGIGSLGGSFRNQNPENSFPALFAETNGTGASITAVTSSGFAAIEAENAGAGDGFAGYFQNTNSANTFPAIQASTAGNASGVRVMQSNGPGAGIDIFMQNPTSSAPGFSVDQGGLGHAGYFAINNNTSGMPSLQTVSNGLGAALAVDQMNNGMAIEMINGGLKYSVANISNTGAITVVAAVYKLNTTGTYALPTNVPEGTFCKVFNGDGSGANVTIDPVFVLGTQSTSTIAAGTIRDFIFINGSWYENP